MFIKCHLQPTVICHCMRKDGSICEGWFTLRKKCPSSELFWSSFSRIWTEYAEIRTICPYSVWMRENADQNNSEKGRFSRRVIDGAVVYKRSYSMLGIFRRSYWTERKVNRGIKRKEPKNEWGKDKTNAVIVC